MLWKEVKQQRVIQNAQGRGWNGVHLCEIVKEHRNIFLRNLFKQGPERDEEANIPGRRKISVKALRWKLVVRDKGTTEEAKVTGVA